MMNPYKRLAELRGDLESMATMIFMELPAGFEPMDALRAWQLQLRELVDEDGKRGGLPPVDWDSVPRFVIEVHPGPGHDGAPTWTSEVKMFGEAGQN
jgi:hypothetical protein